MPTATLCCGAFRGFTIHSFFPSSQPPECRSLSLRGRLERGRMRGWSQVLCRAGPCAGRLVRAGMCLLPGPVCPPVRWEPRCCTAVLSVRRTCRLGITACEARSCLRVYVCVRVCACACGVCVYTFLHVGRSPVFNRQCIFIDTHTCKKYIHICKFVV